LLRDTGRLTFTQARDRMRQYLVAGLKLTQLSPTFVEARDAMMAAAQANDAADYAAFCEAFARRGMGSSAVAPPRFDLAHQGVVESFGCGIEFIGTSLEPEFHGCDADGVTDVGEHGRITVRFRNRSASTLTNLAVGVSCSSPHVSYANGGMAAVASIAAGAVDSVAVTFVVTANTGIENAGFTPRATGAGLTGPGPHEGAPLSAVFNRDVGGVGLTTFDATTGWTNVGWTPVDYGAFGHGAAMSSGDATSVADRRLTSPPFVPATNSVSFRLLHYYSFDHTLAPTLYYDGGVVELSTDNGATWSDIGSSAVSNGYMGALESSLNPLSGRPAFVGSVSDWVQTIFQPAGSFAGQTCRLRFRAGFDEASHGASSGWDVTELEVSLAPGSTFPFPSFVPESDLCSPVSVEQIALTGSLAFSLWGPHPIRGSTRFEIDLPRPSPVTLEVFDVTGRRVSKLVDRVLEPGRHEVEWSAPAARGVYFARLRAMGETRRIRAVVMN
jgi:large repetitive protein